MRKLKLQVQMSADGFVAGPDGQLSGESMTGLARAFFYAGARAMLVTHWSIPSESTVTLMRSTFQRFSQQAGMDKAEALREAQLGLIAEAPTAHPFFWAAFALVGDSTSR